jgi:hypothetical protein
MKYHILKKIDGKYIYYQVRDENGELIKEFDNWNYQKPFHQAKELIKKLDLDFIMKDQEAKDQVDLDLHEAKLKQTEYDH